MNPTLTEFLAWLEQGPYAIPTLPDQTDLKPTELTKRFNLKKEVEWGFGIRFISDEGVIHSISGNQVSFDVSEVGLTWTRFFGLLQTTARNVAYHGTALQRPHTHRMPTAYNQAPRLMGVDNLHSWLDCPNNIACPFIAAAIRAFLLNNLPEHHPLYQWV